jgi:hypothetical protein
MAAPMTGTLTAIGADGIPRQSAIITSGNPAAHASSIPKPARSTAQSTR